MQECTQCHRATPAASPFCTVCDHERIPESLLAPRTLRARSVHAFEGAAAVVGLWLIVTVGVAFLREAQALRWSREDLAAGRAEKAYDRVSPFLAAKPKHTEALLLAGRAGVRSGRIEAAVAHYATLEAIDSRASRKRTKRLRATFDEELPSVASALPCGQADFAALFELFDPVAQTFRETLMQAASALTMKCIIDQNPRVANEPGYWLIHAKGFDPQPVTTQLFIEPIASSIENENFLQARRLAEVGTSLWPASEKRFDEALSETRSRVGLTMDLVRTMVAEMSKDPAFRQGSSRCFPAAAPAAVIARRDAWGNPLTYTPAAPDRRQPECHRAFALTSMGADGKKTAADASTPAADLSCMVTQWGREECDRIDRFWLPPRS